MSTLAEAVAKKIEEKGLNNSAAAEAIGVSVISLRAVLSGKSLPNARSLGKYASFVGLSEDEAKSLVAAGRSAPKKGKGAAKAKGKGKGKAKAAKAGKPGRKPGRAKAEGKAPKAAKGKAGRKARGGASAALAAVAQALAAAESLANDKLAQQVHDLTASQRKIVAAIIGNF